MQNRPRTSTTPTFSHPPQSIVQDVAKNVMDRSEKWGVNRAVRDAVVEVRKNVQKQPIQRQISTREEALARQNAELFARIRNEEDRRRQLARILELGITSLETEESDTSRLIHVKECLLDEKKPLNRAYLQPLASSAHSAPCRPVCTPSHSQTSSNADSPASPHPRAQWRVSLRKPVSPHGNFVATSFGNNSDPDFLSAAERPRATLAQSSFAWMLGDDPAEKKKSSFVVSAKRTTGPGVVDGTEDSQTPSVSVGISRENTRESEEFALGIFKK